MPSVPTYADVTVQVVDAAIKTVLNGGYIDPGPDNFGLMVKRSSRRNV